MTNLQVVYEAFLAKILEDDWENWLIQDAEADWYAILQGALPWFKFPRVSLDIVTDEVSGKQVFSDNLNNEEIQILATYMKCEWLNRNILTWENVKPLYEERDFSQANLLDKFKEMLKKEENKVAKLEGIYYRSIKRAPFDYSKLATQVKNV